MTDLPKRNELLTRFKSGLEQRISAEMDMGMRQAADPINANLPDLAPRTTTLNSPWLAQSCRVCRDKFREGDQVLLCPRCGIPYHEDPQYDLHCWQKQFSHGAICDEGGIDSFGESSCVIPRCDFSWSDPLYTGLEISMSSAEKAISHTLLSQSLVKQFIGGIETSWHTFGNQPRIRVISSSPLVGRRCPFCRFRVRVGEWVVACPCPIACGTYIHQDISRHLTCWNDMNGVKGFGYCPTTGAPLNSDEEGY